MFEDKTPAALKEAMLTGLKERGWNTQDGSFADTVVAPIAVEVQKAYQSMPALIPMFYVDETSGHFIDKSANEFFGITRKPGSRATAAIVFSGEPGLNIPVDTVFLTEDGLEFCLDDPVTLDELGTGAGTVSSLGVGQVYNINAGELTKMHVNIPGLTGYANESAAGGVDPEDDAALFARLDARRKRPPTSGNVYYYEQLALETDGVGLAKGVELYSGPGTVGVLIAAKDGTPVDETVVTACMAHIEPERIIGTGVTVVSAQGVGVRINAAVKLDSTTTADAVQTTLTLAVREYFEELSKVWATSKGDYTLLYNRIAFLLMAIDGVIDYIDLSINGTMGNIVLTATQVPTLGEVTVVAVD